MDFSPLKVKPFRDLWLGQAVSQFGDALYFLVLLFMADRISHSPAFVGLVGAAQALPFVIFGPAAGAMADRYDRKKLMMFSDLSSFFLLIGFAAILLLPGLPPLWSIVAVSFLLSTVNVFFMPAKSASIPRLVPDDILLPANALSSATQHMMPLLGLFASATILGGMAATLGDRFFLIAVLANALTFLVSALYISRLPSIVPSRAEGEHASLLADSKEGFRYAFHHPVLRVLIVMFFFTQLMISPFMIVYLQANREWFGGSYSAVAWLECAFMVGMVLGSLAAGKYQPRRPTVAISGFLFLVGIFVVALAFSRQFWVFCTWNFLAGVLLPYAQIPQNTYLQRVVPDSHRGRVYSALNMAAMSAPPISNALGGPLLAKVGVQWMFGIMGGGLSLVSAAGLLDPNFRRASMPSSEEGELPAASAR